MTANWKMAPYTEIGVEITNHFHVNVWKIWLVVLRFHFIAKVCANFDARNAKIITRLGRV